MLSTEKIPTKKWTWVHGCDLRGPDCVCGRTVRCCGVNLGTACLPLSNRHRYINWLHCILRLLEMKNEQTTEVGI
jgi:hypothetical protein